MVNVIESVSKLSNLPEKNLQKLSQLSSFVICDELCANKDDILEADIGFGTLLIKVDEDTIKYKFNPSKKFENDLKTTIKSGKSPVEALLEQGAVNKMLELYRDLL